MNRLSGDQNGYIASSFAAALEYLTVERSTQREPAEDLSR